MSLLLGQLKGPRPDMMPRALGPHDLSHNDYSKKYSPCSEDDESQNERMLLTDFLRIRCTCSGRRKNVSEDNVVNGTCNIQPWRRSAFDEVL